MTATLTEPTMERNEPLQNYYRPDSLDQVWGHDSVKKNLKASLNEKGRPHCFLFTGPPGTGKTTLARIIAKEVGAIQRDGGVIELDGATSGKIEDIRELIKMMDFTPPPGNKAKVAIIDECQAVTKAAWQGFLKASEDVPSHANYVFCTTDEAKVPKAIVTRCARYELKPLPANLLYKYGNELICPLEKIALPEGALKLISDESGGSPRQFLNFLGLARHATTLKEVRDILVSASADETDPIIQVARMLMNKERSWDRYRAVIGTIENIGSSRAILRAYLSKVVLGSTDWQYWYVVLGALDGMTEFPQERDGLADLELAIFRILRTLGGQP